MAAPAMQQAASDFHVKIQTIMEKARSAESKKE
jgi:hypothetical protein